MSQSRHRPFQGLSPPGAPARLRRRVLDAARAAAAHPATPGGAGRPPLADRAWESRPLRLAWALLVAGLVGANLFLGAPDERTRSPEPGPPERHAAREEADGGRTLLASREAVLRAVFGDDDTRGTGRPPARRPRRPS